MKDAELGYAERSYLRGYRRGASNAPAEPVPYETHTGAFANGYRDGQADYAKARRRASDQLDATRWRCWLRDACRQRCSNVVARAGFEVMSIRTALWWVPAIAIWLTVIVVGSHLRTTHVLRAFTEHPYRSGPRAPERRWRLVWGWQQTECIVYAFALLVRSTGSEPRWMRTVDVCLGSALVLCAFGSAIKREEIAPCAP